MDAASSRRGAGEAPTSAVEAERVPTGPPTNHRLQTGVATRARPRGHRRADPSTTLTTGIVTPAGGSRVRTAGVAVGVAPGSGLSCSFPTMITNRVSASTADTPRWRWLDDPDVAGEDPARWLGREQHIIETIIASIRASEAWRERIANWRFVLDRTDAPAWIDDALTAQETRLRAHARQAVLREIYHAAPERRREIREELVASERATPRAAIVLVEDITGSQQVDKPTNNNNRSQPGPATHSGTAGESVREESMSEAPADSPTPSSNVQWHQITAGQVQSIAPACSTPKLRAHLEAARDADAVDPDVVEALAAELGERGKPDVDGNSASTRTRTSEVAQ